MSTNQTRKPSQASETVITTVVIFIFISAGVLQYYFEKKSFRQAEHKIALPTNTKQELPRSTEPLNLHAEPLAQSLPVDEPLKHIRHKKVVTVQKERDDCAVIPVIPPLPALDLFPENTTVNANTGKVITSTSQSKIVIP